MHIVSLFSLYNYYPFVTACVLWKLGMGRALKTRPELGPLGLLVRKGEEAGPQGVGQMGGVPIMFKKKLIFFFYFARSRGK